MPPRKALNKKRKLIYPRGMVSNVATKRQYLLDAKERRLLRRIPQSMVEGRVDYDILAKRMRMSREDVVEIVKKQRGKFRIPHATTAPILVRRVNSRGEKVRIGERKAQVLDYVRRPRKHGCNRKMIAEALDMDPASVWQAVEYLDVMGFKEVKKIINQ